MKMITRQDLQKLIADKDANVTVVEALPQEKYNDFHIPGAVNVPPGDDFVQRIQDAVPDKDRKVVVYCRDHECDASEKAVEEMEELGYSDVYDYAEGKQGWRAAGLTVIEPEATQSRP